MDTNLINDEFYEGIISIVKNNLEYYYTSVDDLDYIFSNEVLEINSRRIYSMISRLEPRKRVASERDCKQRKMRYDSGYNKEVYKYKKKLVRCECGDVIQQGNLWNHRKLTKRHKEQMQKKNNIDYELDIENDCL